MNTTNVNDKYPEDITIDDRINWAKQIVDLSPYDEHPEDIEEPIADLLHLAASIGGNPRKIIQLALEYYDQEKGT